MAKILVFTGGGFPKREDALLWLGGADGVIAADSGLLLAEEWGFTPDAICGDFDSMLDHDRLARYDQDKIRRHPADKANGDTVLALEEAGWLEDALRANSCAPTQRELETVLVGGVGGRFDHFYSLISLYAGSLFPSVWLTEEQAVITLDALAAPVSVTVTLPVADAGGAEIAGGADSTGTGGQGGPLSVFAVPVTGCVVVGTRFKSVDAEREYIPLYPSTGSGYVSAAPGAVPAPPQTPASKKAHPAHPATSKAAPVVPLAEYRARSNGLVWELGYVNWGAGEESLSNRLAPGRTSCEIVAEKGRFLLCVPLKAKVHKNVVGGVGKDGGRDAPGD